MPGLVPGIHVLVRQSKKDADGRDEGPAMAKKRHDERDGLRLPFRSNIILLATPPDDFVLD
jgi:hypothetical protein